MTIAITRRLIVTAGVVLAVWAGWELAHGSLLPIALLSAMAVAAIAQQLFAVRVDALFAGVVLFGLLVGNRGFAQLSPPLLPLLPAEAALGFGLLVTLWTGARRQTLPIRRDALNLILFLWLVVTALRLPFDLRQFGITAMRDFAMVYYGLFFFLAQHWAAAPDALRWVRFCLLAGLVAAPLAFEAFKAWPEGIIAATQVRGIPLIYIKGDSAAALMAGGAAWCGCLAVSRRRFGYALLAAVLLTSVLLSNSRAALVALLVILAWLCAARAGRLLRGVAIYGLVGLTAAVAVAAFSKQSWHESEIYRTYERLASVVDFSGERVYRSSILQDKAANNDFRLTWWRIVARQTWEEGRWLGVGFGRELAAEFTRIYYPELDEAFTARSPHNIGLSIYARSGMVGLATFLAVIACMVRSTWRAARRGVDDTLGLWLFAWGVLVSACFGVVLEGPMGAVPFWIVLGLASAASARTAEEASPDVAAPDDRHLPAEASTHQVTAIS